MRAPRWPSSLYARLGLVLLCVVVLLGAAGTALTVWTAARYGEEAEQRLNRDLAADLLSDAGILEEGPSPAELDHIFHVLMVVNPRIEVYLLDRDGRILAYSAPEGRVVRERVDPAPIRAFLAGEPLPVRGDDPRDRDRRTVFSAAPVPAAGRGQASESGGEAGYLYVVLSGEEAASVLDRLRGSAILRGAGAVAAVALAAALAAGLFLFRHLTRRLERLDASMSAFLRRGDGPPPPPAPGDEVDRLQATFEQMARRIEEQVDELAQHDELRRKLVANVSHDLRTPLAALHGYLETLLLKDDALNPSQRRQYLESAARHSEQLGKLVTQLFELARLDVEEARLETETVPLGELVQDVVQKFGLAARERGVTLEATLAPELPPVEADIRLLERAFDNLLENALAHTSSGGRVCLELRRSEDGVGVRCVDDGTGIPAHELPRVFDRFYRGESDRGGGGAGLGLAIASRILELHGARLEVESEVGRGTAFSFALPAAGGGRAAADPAA